MFVKYIGTIFDKTLFRLYNILYKTNENIIHASILELIENGFISNPTEAAKISSSSHQQKLAEIIANVVSEKL